MTKYAIISSGVVTELVAAPDPLPLWAADDAAWLAKQFPSLSGFTQVPDDTLPGATDNGDGTFANPTQVVPSKPKALSKTAFMKHAVGQFAATNSTNLKDSYARYYTVMSVAKSSSDDAVRAAHEQYDIAIEVSKAEVETLTQWMVDATGDTDRLTSAERTAVLDNWPT